jgi:hypothetical protein
LKNKKRILFVNLTAFLGIGGTEKVCRSIYKGNRTTMPPANLKTETILGVGIRQLFYVKIPIHFEHDTFK